MSLQLSAIFFFSKLLQFFCRCPRSEEIVASFKIYDLHELKNPGKFSDCPPPSAPVPIGMYGRKTCRDEFKCFAFYFQSDAEFRYLKSIHHSLWIYYDDNNNKKNGCPSFVYIGISTRLLYRTVIIYDRDSKLAAFQNRFATPHAVPSSAFFGIHI